MSDNIRPADAATLRDLADTLAPLAMPLEPGETIFVSELWRNHFAESTKRLLALADVLDSFTHEDVDVLGEAVTAVEGEWVGTERWREYLAGRMGRVEEIADKIAKLLPPEP